ncbi:MAG TPA: sigma-70 family RNA polymerase sigma factor [Polyangiaceae bacterium]|nr:sigma-70 family RNA polymerase sigma factor [Polyangiaceae bacterium]
MRVTDSLAYAADPCRDSALSLDGVGEMSGFPEIYRKYFNFVWSCTRRFGIPENEVEDVVQEIFVVIHARLQTLERSEALRSWIYGIIRRTASTYRRNKRVRAAHAEALRAEPEVTYPQMPSPLDLAEQTDQVRLLWSLIEQLDPPKREAFVLAELDEMTVPEIAAAINVPLNTVYSRIRVARQELEQALAKHETQPLQQGRS